LTGEPSALTQPGDLSTDPETAEPRPSAASYAYARRGRGTSGARTSSASRPAGPAPPWKRTLAALAAVRTDDLPHLHTFANGLERDHAAVLSGLTLPYSSGAVEGKVAKIKFWKRLMFGRANLDLLRKMALWN
jgi:hypothetical protein